MVAQATQDAVAHAERARAVANAKWDGIAASIEIIRAHGGEWAPLLVEQEQVAATISIETVRYRLALAQVAREVQATAEELLGQWWDNNEYGESVLDESAMRFLNEGIEC